MTKSLPPLTALDRMGNGEHLGQCPTCGGVRWWDDRGRKRAGDAAPDAADFRCVDCRHGRWEDGRHEPGRSVARRRPAVRTILVETVAPAAGGATRCAATTKSGKPCGGMAMAGSAFCGPHSGVGSADRGGGRCEGTTKAGRPCGAGAVRGERFCPAHAPD